MNPNLSPKLNTRLLELLKKASRETHKIHPREDASPLAQECKALYDNLQLDDGICRAKQDEGWETNYEAHLYLGIGFHLKHEYDLARSSYQTAAELSDDPTIVATCIANCATCYFEELKTDEAASCYEQALTIDDENVYALLGLISIACQLRDEAELRTAAQRLVNKHPDWTQHHVILDTLRVDRCYAFLREDPSRIERLFGAPLPVHSAA
jgi:tetratricopeptide (TPR) repeat protein